MYQFIHSLKVFKKITIHIISDLSEQEIEVPRKIIQHKNLNKINFYQIYFPELNLYNLEEAHVTEATFYRMFLENHLSFDDYVTYLDCDVLCINNPIPSINKVIFELEQSDRFISFNRT